MSYLKKHKIFFSALFLSLLLFSGCKTTKQIMPVEEIDRALSLPPKTFGLSIAGLVDMKLNNDSWYGSRYNYYLYGNIPQGLYAGNFAFPYVKLGERVELHFSLLSLKYYVLKNTTVTDGVYSIDGANLAVGIGTPGFFYLNNDLNLYLNGYTQFKKKFSEMDGSLIIFHAHT